MKTEYPKQHKASRSTRAVTITCVVCHVEITGVVDANGVVHASDRSRPDPGTPPIDGLCMEHADNEPTRGDWERLLHMRVERLARFKLMVPPAPEILIEREEALIAAARRKLGQQ